MDGISNIAEQYRRTKQVDGRDVATWLNQNVLTLDALYKLGGEFGTKSVQESMASTTTKAATILELCRVAPPPAAGSPPAEQRLPLTFLDMPWLHFHPILRLLFFQFPCSKSHFLEAIIPNMKNSLSNVLKHYLPLAGSLLYPLDSGMPQFRYSPGDSVSVTIAESSKASDFNYLTGNEFRVADDFYPFVPSLPEPTIDSESGFKIIPLLSIQITLFQDFGISIGFCNHHSIGDANSIVGFIKNWSLLCRLGESSAQNITVPIFDRSLMKDPSGLANIYWEQMKHFMIKSSPLKFPTNLVRATYVLKRDDIQRLKNLALSKIHQDSLHVSTFTVAAAYVWTCLIKSAAKTGEQVDSDETEIFAFAVDSRSRLNPPLPGEYFGNCVAFAKTGSTHGQLQGADGFSTAVELIGDYIRKKVNNGDELFRDAETWLTEYGALMGKRMFSVAGSPRFDLYGVDFGWGRPKKLEAVSIDGEGSMSLSKSRECEGGLEIGLSLPKAKMESFAALFSDGLKIY